MEDLRKKSARFEEDRISALPDELIHRIFSFIDSNFAVQTSVLSKRWVNLWSTLRFLNFEPTLFDKDTVYFANFVVNFLSRRNQQSEISTVKMDLTCFHRFFADSIMDAFSQNVKQFHLRGVYVEGWLDFPVLETFNLSNSYAHLRIWKMPSLTTLHLQDVNFGQQHNGAPWALGFEDFHNLKNLTLVGCGDMYSFTKVFRIDSRSLESLTLSQFCTCGPNSACPPTCKFVVLAPKLSFFKFCGKYVPILSAEDDGFPCLEEVNLDIKIQKMGCILYRGEEEQLLVPVMHKLVNLFYEFRGTKCLRLSFKTVEALSRVPDFSKYRSSPFGNLKSLNLFGQVPLQSTNPTYSTNHVIDYLLNGSRGVMIFIQDHMGKIRSYNSKEDILLNEGRGYCVGKLKEHIALEKYVTSNFQVNGDAVQAVLKGIPHAIIRSLVNDSARSYRETGLWTTWEDGMWESVPVHRDCEVLLKHIEEQHPETFENFAPKFEIIRILALNTLCSSIASLSEVARTSFSCSTLTRHKGMFGDLEKWGLNIKWLTNDLNNTDGRSVDHRSNDADRNQ